MHPLNIASVAERYLGNRHSGFASKRLRPCVRAQRAAPAEELLSRLRRPVILACILLLLAGSAFAEQPRPKSISVVMDDNYPPYVFRDNQGVVQGILIDRWRLWEQKTGIKVEIHAMAWIQALQRMRAGAFDVIDMIYKTDERLTYLDYSRPYQKIDVPIFFDREIAGITDAKSLTGFVVGVKAGHAVIDLLRREGVENLRLFDSYAAILQAAKERKVAVFVVDKPPALYYLYKLGIQDRFRQSAPLQVFEFHRAVAHGNLGLLQIVEAGFARLTPGELKAIEDKWYGTESFGARSMRQFLPAAATAGLLLLALFVWNGMLRRAVRRQTAELKASEERFRSIYDSVNDAVFIHDLETGAILDVNARMCAMYGCTRDEAIRATIEQWSSGVPPYSRTEVLAWLKATASGKAQTFPWQCRRKDGSLFWGEVSTRRARLVRPT